MSSRIKEGFETVQIVSVERGEGKMEGLTEGTCQRKTGVAGADDDDIVGILLSNLRDGRRFRDSCGGVRRVSSAGVPWDST